MKDKLLTTLEVAEKLRVTKFYVSRNWINWIDYGVNPIRLNGKANGNLLFKESEIENLIDQWRVYKDESHS